ncbi:MAG TPA: carboxypeptidase regulatory-like domain-containing protein [Candidatus Wunengus sp. YC65]|uniref:carboxypeptidase regulatory-like domain-containing protein n=1 Tax=Candidatus Wunengus sp. YC65 TaxID=3367701 RepID=UPI004026CD7D
MNWLNKVFMPLGIVSGLLFGTHLMGVNMPAVQAASIMCVVTDENGDAIEDAVIKINSKGKKKKATLTDSDGSCEVNKLKKGKHKLTVESVGYETVSETLTISKNNEEVEKNFILNFSTYSKANTTDEMDAAVSAFSEIGTLRKEETIDGDAIEAAYEGELQDLVQEMDTENSLTLDSDITDAIEDIKNSNEPKLAAQVIDKTLQRVFYLAVLENITHARDDFEEDDTSELSQYWDQAYAAYQALVGTADRENKVLTSDRTNIDTGNNPNLEDQIIVAFIRGQKALEKKDSEEDEITLGIQRQVIRLSLVRAFYIAVLREVGELLENRDSDAEEALVELKEAEVYYRIVEEFVSRDNPTGNETVKSQLTGELSNVVADTIVSELSKGFIGRVEGELEENEEALSENNRGDAMILAEEALLYSGVFLEDLELRLGAENLGEIEDALNDLRDASDKLSTSDADTARQTITTIINNYESELL